MPAPPRASIVFSETSHPSAVPFSSTPAPAAQLMWLRWIWTVHPGPTRTVPWMRQPTSVDDPEGMSTSAGAKRGLAGTSEEARGLCGRLGEHAVDGRAAAAGPSPLSVRPSSVPERSTIGPRSVAPGASATSVTPTGTRNGPRCTPTGTVTVSPGRADASAALNEAMRKSGAALHNVAN